MKLFLACCFKCRTEHNLCGSAIAPPPEMAKIPNASRTQVTILISVSRT